MATALSLDIYVPAKDVNMSSSFSKSIISAENVFSVVTDRVVSFLEKCRNVFKQDNLDALETIQKDNDSKRTRLLKSKDTKIVNRLSRYKHIFEIFVLKSYTKREFSTIHYRYRK